MMCSVLTRLFLICAIITCITHQATAQTLPTPKTIGPCKVYEFDAGPQITVGGNVIVKCTTGNFNGQPWTVEKLHPNTTTGDFWNQIGSSQQASFVVSSADTVLQMGGGVTGTKRYGTAITDNTAFLDESVAGTVTGYKPVLRLKYTAGLSGETALAPAIATLASVRVNKCTVNAPGRVTSNNPAIFEGQSTSGEFCDDNPPTQIGPCQVWDSDGGNNLSTGGGVTVACRNIDLLWWTRRPAGTYLNEIQLTQINGTNWPNPLVFAPYGSYSYTNLSLHDYSLVNTSTNVSLAEVVIGDPPGSIPIIISKNLFPVPTSSGAVMKRLVLASVLNQQCSQPVSSIWPAVSSYSYITRAMEAANIAPITIRTGGIRCGAAI